MPDHLKSGSVGCGITWSLGQWYAGSLEVWVSGMRDHLKSGSAGTQTYAGTQKCSDQMMRDHLNLREWRLRGRFRQWCWDILNLRILGSGLRGSPTPWTKWFVDLGWWLWFQKFDLIDTSSKSVSYKIYVVRSFCSAGSYLRNSWTFLGSLSIEINFPNPNSNYFLKIITFDSGSNFPKNTCHISTQKLKTTNIMPANDSNIFGGMCYNALKHWIDTELKESGRVSWTFKHYFIKLPNQCLRLFAKWRFGRFRNDNLKLWNSKNTVWRKHIFPEEK